MNCSKCGFQINQGEDYCQKCGGKDVQNTLLYQEEISTPSSINTPDSNNTSNKTKTIKTKILHFIIKFILLLAVLISVGYGSYYISFEKFTSENLEKSQKLSEKKNKDTSSDDVISKENSDKSSDVLAPTNKIDSPDYYFFPKSKSEKLLDSDVSILSKQNLALARNEIFARHGYVFGTDPFKSYFNNKTWYKPNPKFKGSAAEFNAIESYNIKLISKYEK